MLFRSSRVTLLSIAALVCAHTLATAEPQAKTVEVNGVKLTYLDEGRGEPVVFVHGAVADLRAWKPVGEALSDGLRFIALTQRYFGTGEWPDKGEQFGIKTHADDVAAVIEALDLGAVHLVGWSYGANVATAAALNNPSLVQSVILFEPALSSLVKEGEAGDAARQAENKMYRAATGAVQLGEYEDATKLLIEGVFQMAPGGFESQPPEVRAMQLDNARTMPLLWGAAPWAVTCDMLKGLDTPTLIVYGGDSNAYWLHVAQVMDECLPRAEVAVLPNVNHDGPVRDPAGFAAMINNFVARH